MKIRNIFGYTYLQNGIRGDIDGTPYGIDDNGDGGKNDDTRQYSRRSPTGRQSVLVEISIT